MHLFLRTENFLMEFCHSKRYKIKYILKLQLGTNESDKKIDVLYFSNYVCVQYLLG